MADGSAETRGARPVASNHHSVTLELTIGELRLSRRSAPMVTGKDMPKGKPAPTRIEPGDLFGDVTVHSAASVSSPLRSPYR